MSLFETSIRSTLTKLFPFSEVVAEVPFLILKVSDTLFFHLVSLDKVSSALLTTYFEDLSNTYTSKNQQIIHVWEDHWVAHQAVICSRLASLAGVTTKIHGRKTKVRRIDQDEFYSFLNANHLQGAVSAKYKLGLFAKDRLVAVAGFSHPRKITRGEQLYRSSELIRFCNLIDHTVIGGMDKLLKHFITNFTVDDVMSYADRDWSNGKSYLRLGFAFIEQTKPTSFWVDLTSKKRYFEHSLAKELNLTEEKLHTHLIQHNFLPITNSGNLKFIKDLLINKV